MKRLLLIFATAAWLLTAQTVARDFSLLREDELAETGMLARNAETDKLLENLGSQRTVEVSRLITAFEKLDADQLEVALRFIHDALIVRLAKKSDGVHPAAWERATRIRFYLRLAEVLPRP